MGVDISTTGASFAGGDDVEAVVTLGRAFQLYDEELQDVYLCSNGFLTGAAGGASDSTGDCPLPAVPSAGGGGRIYALHDDLVTTTFYAEYFAACPRPAEHGTGTIGCTVLQWDGVTHAGGPAGTWDQWVYLYDNSDIVVEIGAGNPEHGAGSTTGLQDSAAAIGLVVACSTPASVPDQYAVLLEFPCDQSSGTVGSMAPPTTSLTLTGPTTINAAEGTINATPDPSYRGGGIFSFIDVDIQAGATVTFAGATAPEIHATGTITLNGSLDLDGSTGSPSNNGTPGGALQPGLAGGGAGGIGGCGVGWESRLGMRGGGSTGGFGGTHPPGSSGFADVTGGGGGGNGTAGVDGDPPIGAFTTEPGRGGSANVDPLYRPLRGGGGGGGGGCDVDDASGAISSGTANDGGAGGGSGGGAIRLQASGNITIGGTGSISADGGNGGSSGGNGGSAGAGAGGTVLIISAADITFNGTISAQGGAGGVLGQPGSGANGGAGGDGIVGLWDTDGVIAGTGTSTPAAITGTSPVFQITDLCIDNLDLPDASSTQPYTGMIQASGGSGTYTFSVVAGSLPAGLNLDPASGDLTGTSTATAGTRSEFTVSVDDGVSICDRAFCILTRPNAMAINTTSLPGELPAMPYSQTIGHVGGTGTPTWTVIDGSLPSGLALNPTTGDVTGTTGPDFEMATFLVSLEGVLDEVDAQTFLIQVGARSLPLVAPLAPAQECIAYSQTFLPTGGTPPHTFEIASGALPAGFALNPSTGEVTGTATVGTAAGSPYPICLYVYDSVGLMGTLTVDFTVNPPPTLPPVCTLDAPVTPPPVSGSITLTLTPTPTCPGTVDVDSIEYSLDGGMTFLGPCTPAPTSPIVPPQAGIPGGGPTSFIWASGLDGVATMAVESNVLLRATISDPAGSSTCDTLVFEVDNQCHCGDCNLSGSLPITFTDAIEGAMIAAGRLTASGLQQRCCDVDATGSVTILDALLMARSSAGLPVTLTCP
jgi:hypothetical protein